MNHKQLPITILSLCIVIGAIVFSEFTPATLFESGSLHVVSNKHLFSIMGKADCSCATLSCGTLSSVKCTWTPEGEPGTGEGYCSGCEYAIGDKVRGPWGDYEECYYGGEPAPGVFGCCMKQCAYLGCPSTCGTAEYKVIWDCFTEEESHCVFPCYSGPL